MSSHPKKNINPMHGCDYCPEICIIDSTRDSPYSSPTIATSPSSGSASRKSSCEDPIIYRKLRRRRGDRRSRMGLSNQHPSSFSKGNASLALLLLLLFQIAEISIVGVQAAYLNGANSKLPASTETITRTNQRYTFLTSRKEKYFTYTGVLPPFLPPSPQKEKQDLRNLLPPIGVTETEEPPIQVTYTNDPKKVDEWLCSNIPYDGGFLGFDIERLPECRSGKHLDPSDRFSFAHAAVVQLATPTACLVVHLVDSSQKYRYVPKHSNKCAKVLRSVLEDPSIIKAGCSIDEDLVFLHELWGGKQTKPKSSNGSNSNTLSTNNRLAKIHEKNTIHVGGTGKKQQTDDIPTTPKKSKSVLNSNKPGRGHSLQARSRFDLGCVVLPGKGVDSPRDVTLAQHEPFHHQHLLNNPHHYKIKPRRITTIANKSGLQGLCKSILDVDLPKERNDCTSDWTQYPLTDDQITYAARDAWAGVAIAMKLASINEGKNGYNAFAMSNLIQVLKRAETPIPQLAKRHRQRKEAKTELQSLLTPYENNAFLDQRNERRHLERQLKHQVNSTSTAIPIQTNVNNTDIDVEALFASYPLSSRRTLANYAQRQQQLMEQSLPKRIRKRSLVLRQKVNAKVIDHKVVFEIGLEHPGTTKQQQRPLAVKCSRKDSDYERHTRPRSRYLKP